MLLAPCPGVRVWKGDRARSLYPDSQRPATLCRQPRAYPEPFALVGPAAPDPRELFLGGMKKIGGSGSSAGGHDTKCDKYFLCKSRGTVTTRNRPVPGRRRRRAKARRGRIRPSLTTLISACRDACPRPMRIARCTGALSSGARVSAAARAWYGGRPGRRPPQGCCGGVPPGPA